MYVLLQNTSVWIFDTHKPINHSLFAMIKKYFFFFILANCFPVTKTQNGLGWFVSEKFPLKKTIPLMFLSDCKELNKVLQPRC